MGVVCDVTCTPLRYAMCSVVFNFIGRDFFNALSEKNVDAFQLQLLKYLGAFVVGIPVFVFKDFYRVRASGGRPPLMLMVVHGLIFSGDEHACMHTPCMHDGAPSSGRRRTTRSGVRACHITAMPHGHLVMPHNNTTPGLPCTAPLLSPPARALAHAVQAGAGVAAVDDGEHAAAVHGGAHVLPAAQQRAGGQP